jgi:hypothetical protein
MKNLFCVVTLALFHAGAIAGDIELVREGCNTLPSAAKKTSCLAAASRLNSGGKASGPANALKGQDLAKSKVLALLNDPESAKFRSISVSPGSGATCGFVSAKNSMGGYGEAARFIVNSESARVDSPPSPGFEYRWTELCGDI